MVVRSPLGDAELDRLFRALADATRRDIVARVLAGEPLSVTALAARYDMSFAAVQKHVAVLEGAGLVTKEAHGRERMVRGNPERIAPARALLAQLEGLWRARLDRLDALLAEPKPLSENEPQRDVASEPEPDTENPPKPATDPNPTSQET